MKKLFCLSSRTKAEYNAGVPGATVPPAHFATLAAAKTQMRTNIAANTGTFYDIYGPSGLVFRGRNPGGA